MPDPPEDPGPTPTYDMLNLDNNLGIRNTWERKHKFLIEDEHMNWALCNIFLGLLAPEIQRAFEEDLMSISNMKFKDMCDHFWNIYGRATQEEALDNKNRDTTAWQSHQGFEALVAQIENCLVYEHFTKKPIPNEDLINAFLIVIKKTD